MNTRIKKATIMMIGTGVNALIGLLTVPLITHIVSPINYGIFSLIQTYISVLVSISLLGLEQAYVRFYYSDASLDYRIAFTKKIIKIPIVISFFVAMIFGVISVNLVEITKISQCLIALCVLVTVAETFTRLNIRMEQDTYTYSVILVIHRILFGVIALICLHISTERAVEILLLATVVSLFVILVIAIVRKRYIWLNTRDVNCMCISTSVLLKYSAPFIFSSLANWIFNATSKFSLQHYTSYSEIGYFAAASNIVALITIFQTTFSTIWVPMAIEHYEKKPQEKNFFVKSNDLVCLAMVTLGMCLVVLKDVFGWILGGNYAMATYIFPCLILHPVLFTISETTVYGINFFQKTYWHIVITVLSCIANIIGNIILVPELGAKGAAISTGLSYVVFLFVRTILSNKYYKVNFNYIKMIVAITILIFYCVYSSFSNTDWICLVMFLIGTLSILLVYRDTVKYLIVTIGNIFKNRRNSKQIR